MTVERGKVIVLIITIVEYTTEYKNTSLWTFEQLFTFYLCLIIISASVRASIWVSIIFRIRVSGRAI